MQPKLFRIFSIVIGKKSGLRQNLLVLGAFTSEVGCFCSEKEQKQGVWVKTHQGATYSQETGCTLFTLLNSIRAQGATTCKVWFIGWRLSWGNVSHKCAARRFVYPFIHGWPSVRPSLHKNKARASLL
ncbi:hypothetical protein ACSHWC_08490 [Pseudomonas fluorescens]